MVVERRRRRVVREQRIDLFRGKAAKPNIEQRIVGCFHAVIDEELIHSVIACEIPASANAMPAPREMSERAMQGLVGEQELRVREVDADQIVRVVVDGARVGRDGAGARLATRSRCSTSAPKNGRSRTSRARAPEAGA